MISQWVLMGSLVLVGLYLLKAKRSANHQALRRLFMVIVLIVGFLAVLLPEYTTSAAALLGIGRGADLLLYTFVVFALFYSVYQYRRQLWQEKITTDLARSLTLSQASLEDAMTERGSTPR